MIERTSDVYICKTLIAKTTVYPIQQPTKPVQIQQIIKTVVGLYIKRIMFFIKIKISYNWFYKNVNEIKLLKNINL